MITALLTLVHYDGLSAPWRQLADTEQLIARTTAEFEQRHSKPMPDDNVWLTQRRAEHAALTQLLSTMDAKPAAPFKAPISGRAWWISSTWLC